MKLSELEASESDKQVFREVYDGLTNTESVSDVDFVQDDNTVVLRAEYSGTADDYRLALLRGEAPAEDVYESYEENGVLRPEDNPYIGVKINDDSVYFENEYRVGG